MTTLQEAAMRNALEALEQLCQAATEVHHSRFNPNWFTNGRSAAQQHEILWLKKAAEYTRNAQPVIEELRTTLAQQVEPVAYITDTHQGPMVWTPEMYDEACTYCDDGEFPVPLYTVEPAPQAQPMTDPCKTCSHFKKGNLPGVRIHDETCYECRSYWGNKWEAA